MLSHPSAPSSPLVDPLRRILASAAIPIDLHRGDRLFQAGEAATAVYWLGSGAIHLRRIGHEGNEMVMHEVRAGEFFAEMAATTERYLCDAVAVQDASAWRLPVPALERALRDDPDVAAAWTGVLARRMQATRVARARLALRSASDRVRHLLLSEGRGTCREWAMTGPTRDLALRLGLSPETLYRTLTAMQRAGELERVGPVLRLATPVRPPSTPRYSGVPTP